MDILQRALDKVLEKEISNIDKPISEEKLQEIVDDVVANSLPSIVEDVYLSLTESSSKMLDESRNDTKGFVERNIERWRLGFDSLEILIVTCSESGEILNKRYRTIASENEDLVFDVSIRLHARACHIASEILWLLKGGYADAAQARWRALHEVVVTALFICAHDNDLAERYLNHEVVESYRGMVQYNQYEPRLNIQAIPVEEVEECKIVYDELLDLYGKNYRRPYGWASKALNNPDPKFTDIEEKINLDHMRPYYKWASQNIHANVKGLKNRLGLVETKEDILLVGPSNSGMTDPADATAISLSQITIDILNNTDVNFDSLVMMKIIEKMSKEVGERFWKAEQQSKLKK